MSIYDWIRVIEGLKSEGIKIAHIFVLEAVYPHKEKFFSVALVGC